MGKTSGDQSSELSSATGRVRLGRYTLDLDHPGGTTLTVTPGASADEVPAPLTEALAHPEPATRPTGPLERANKLIDAASEVTDRVENVVGILESIARGHPPGAGVIAQEGDDVLAALGRLNGHGHFDGVVKLGRPACRLFALTLRWAALVESLRLVLHAGTALADTPTTAWAEHELGSLHLAAGQPERARELLEAARDRRARIDDREGLAATEHNLKLLTREAGGSHRLRRPVVVGGVVLLALLLGLAAAVGGGTSSSAQPSSGRPSATGSHRTKSRAKSRGKSRGNTKGRGKAVAPVLTTTPAALDFGSQAAGTTSVPKTVTLTASGGSVAIGRAAMTGTNRADFVTTEDNCSGHTIAAGRSCTLGVTFSAPRTPFRAVAVVIPHSPTLSATLGLPNSASTTPPQIALSGAVAAAPATPIATVSPASATITAGTGASQTFTLSNSGSGPLSVSTVTLGGADPTAFVLGPGCSNSTVEPNQSCSVTVTASPGLGAGTATAALAFNDNASDSPQTAALTAIAQQAQ